MQGDMREIKYVRENYPEVFGKSRKREVVYKRQLYAYFLRDKTPMPFKAIGKELGLDHASIMYSYQQVQHYMNVKDEGFYYHTKEMMDYLYPDAFKIQERKENKLKLKLKELGLEGSNKYDIVAEIGSRKFTYHSFVEFLKDLTDGE